MLEALKQKHCEDPRAWVEGNLTFNSDVSPNHPGAVSLSRQLWMAEILKAFLDPSVSDLYLCMGAQTGKTICLLLGAGLLAEFDPNPLIWAAPTDKLASRISRTRIQPFFQGNPILSKHIRRSDDVTTEAIYLDVMPIFIWGAMSPSKISSQPVAYLLIDEEAKIEHTKRKEAHPVLLLEERTKAFSRRLHVHASTPNTEENIFWRGFLQTDYRKLFIPCPHCGVWQTLEFSRETVQWDHPESGVTAEVVRSTAHYVCPHCQNTITDEERLAAIAKGVWKPTREGAASNKRGYHLNSMYSPFITIGEFAASFWSARNNGLGSLAYQNFVNSWQALPYVAYVLKVDDEKIPALCGDYRRGTLPATIADYYYICVCYDPGDSATHWVATMICPGGNMYVIDWGTCASLVTDEAAGRVGVAAHYMSLEFEGRRPDFGYVDSGDRAQLVYQECERTGGAAAGGLNPSKGIEASYGTWNQVALKEYPLLDLITYSDLVAKTELYSEIISRASLAALHLPQDIDAELVAGLSGQTLELLPSGRRRWKKVKNDHYGDCIKLARVSWWVNRNFFETPAPV